MASESPCPHCGGRSIFRRGDVSSGGGYGPRLLPGLGRLFFRATFTILVCEACGLTRFFADKEARSKLAQSGSWTRVR